MLRNLAEFPTIRADLAQAGWKAKATDEPAEGPRDARPDYTGILPRAGPEAHGAGDAGMLRQEVIPWGTPHLAPT